MGPITGKRVLLRLSVLFNFVVPWALYRLSEPYAGETRAIVLSAVVPAIWSLVQFARNRKVDLMSAIVLGGIGLSLIGLALGGSPKLLLFRGTLITGLLGVVFIGSAIIRRPLMFVFVRAALSRQSMEPCFPRASWRARATRLHHMPANRGSSAS